MSFVFIASPFYSFRDDAQKMSEFPDLQSNPSLLLWDFLPDLGDFQLLQLDPTEGDSVGSEKKYRGFDWKKKQILKKHDKDIVRTAFKRRMHMDIHHV